MRALILWLFNKIVPWIEQSLDPELKGRLDALNARVAAAEAKEQEAAELQRLSEERYRQSELAYAESERRRAELDVNLAESKRAQEVERQALLESEARRKVIRDEVEKLNAAVDARSDDDLILGGVPKPRS